jgi:diguanylate cyclase (GGDEF)-like protein
MLRPALLVIGLASLGYVPVHLYRNVPGAEILAPVAAFFGVSYLSAWLWTRRRPVPAGWNHPVFTAVVIVTAYNTILNQALVRDPMLTFDMAMVLILTGMCIVSKRWALLTMAVSIAGWFGLVAPRIPAAQLGSAAVTIGLAFGGGTLINTGRRRALARLLAVTLDAERAAVVDSLTQVYNRRGLSLVAAHVVRTARRTGEQVGVLVIDIDAFKAINDELGHQAGDQTLVAVADALRTGGRDSDVVARWGGDEFVVITLGTAPDATELARRVEQDLVERAIVGAGGKPVRVSVGAANVAAVDDPDAIDQLIIAADAAMYAGRAQRRTGRQRVVSLERAQNLSIGL